MDPITLTDCRIITTMRFDTRQILLLLWERIKSHRSRVTLDITCDTVEVHYVAPCEGVDPEKP